MTNHAQGHAAEKVAVRYLQGQGYKVYALNWRHPRAEIDIVAQIEGGPVMFIEVKYRQTARQGTGLDYITASKLKQMSFAAQLWVAQHKYHGEYVLGAIELAGPNYEVTNFLADIS